MYRTIIVHVDTDDPASTTRIRCAAGLARTCHALLIGVAARMPRAAFEVLAANGPVVAGRMAGPDSVLDQIFDEAKSEFERIATLPGIDVSWRTAVDFPSRALAKMASLADLVVTGPREESGDGYTAPDCGDLVMRAGRPLLVVPRSVTEITFQAGTIVAWKNTREARRALADALPLLALSGNVTLVSVREQEDVETSLDDATAFLDAHGIGASRKVLERGPAGAGVAILDFARRSAADLIVAGAYGHTRMREWAFGGVTSDLLNTGTIPVLLSR